MMPDSPLTSTQITLRVLAAIFALAAGVTAVVIAVLLLQTALN